MKARRSWVLAVAAAAPLVVHCGRRSSPGDVHATSDPIASASASADAGPDADALADGPRTLPTIACDVGPEVAFSTASATSFTCSPLVTSKAAVTAGPRWVDDKGAALTPTPLDLTVAPGTLVSISVGATN